MTYNIACSKTKGQSLRTGLPRNSSGEATQDFVIKDAARYATVNEAERALADIRIAITGNTPAGTAPNFGHLNQLAAARDSAREAMSLHQPCAPWPDSGSPA